MTLEIFQSVVTSMKNWGKANSNEEVCGVLLGSKESEDKWRANEFIKIDNVNKDRARDRYTLDPLHFVTVLETTRHANKDATKDFIGIFHTHPNHRAVPSIIDIEGAGYNVFYLIYSPRFDELSTHFCIQTKNSWQQANLTIV